MKNEYKRKALEYKWMSYVPTYCGRECHILLKDDFVEMGHLWVEH